METEGLAIFACAAGVVNAVDPFEMGKMQHELQSCLPPLQLSQEMREFITAPTPPPAVPIPFPEGLFSPPASPQSPPQETFRFPETAGFRGEFAGKNASCKQRRHLGMDQKSNNVVKV